MAELVTLTCPSCGAKLEIGEDIERFACSHCGNEHIVKRSGGTVSLMPVLEQIKKVRAGVDKTASELAIKRLKEEIREIQSRMPAFEEGCFTKVMNWFMGLFALATLGAILTGDWGNIIGASALLAGSITIGYFIRKKEDVSMAEKRKPYIDAIAQRKRELEKHEKIVRGE